MTKNIKSVLTRPLFYSFIWAIILVLDLFFRYKEKISTPGLLLEGFIVLFLLHGEIKNFKIDFRYLGWSAFFITSLLSLCVTIKNLVA